MDNRQSNHVVGRGSTTSIIAIVEQRAAKAKLLAFTRNTLAKEAASPQHQTGRDIAMRWDKQQMGHIG